MAQLLAFPAPSLNEAHMQSLLDESPDGLLSLDDHGRVQFSNPAAARLLGRPFEGVVGRPFASIFHVDDRDRAADLLDDLVASAGGVTQGSLGAHVDDVGGRVLDVVVRDCRHEPDVRGFIVTLRDTTIQTERERDLVHRVAHDLLTGAVSRGEFLDRLERAVSDPRGADRLGLLFVDVDHFKIVNDQFGHHVGDRTLVSVCRLIQNSVRDGDVVARFGGDEFVALLRNVQDPDALRDAAERVVHSVRVSGQVDDEVLAVTVSVGGALNEGDDAASLLRRADHALLEAKEHGRDRVVLDRVRVV